MVRTQWSFLNVFLMKGFPTFVGATLLNTYYHFPNESIFHGIKSSKSVDIDGFLVFFYKGYAHIWLSLRGSLPPKISTKVPQRLRAGPRLGTLV